MSTPSSEPRAAVLRGLLLASVLALSLVASVVLAPRVAAMGEPAAGFAEAAGPAAEQFQVMGANWMTRSNMTFQHTEIVRVNVTSTVVNVAVGGAGATETLSLVDYRGSPVGPAVAFTQHTLASPFVYSASIDLSTRTAVPDWYYLRILIDDTVNAFRATAPIQVGAPSTTPHSIQTYSDAQLRHPSDVFTSTSTVWVRMIGNPGGDTNQWDLEQYLNGASVVGGPLTVFDNFQARVGVYTFSIDLSAFAGYVQGWPYTLLVSLTNTAFNAGTQIWIYDPTVTVASTNLAPAQAVQGQTQVPMLGMTLTLNGPGGGPWSAVLGPATFTLDRLRITRTGTGVNADVSGVHVWLDANGNSVIDSGDTQVASVQNPTGLTFPLWVGPAGGDMVAVNSTGALHLIVTYDIAPGATVGDTVGARVANPGDVDMPYSVTVTGTPLASSNVLIAGATVLTATDDPGVAPGSAAQGLTNVPIDLLHLSSNSGTLTVTQIAISLQGTGRPADISAVTLHLATGGAYNPATAPQLGTARTFPASGPAVFGGLNLGVTGAGRGVWVVFNISANARVGDDVGSVLPANTSIRLTSGTVYNGTFPLASGLTTVAGNTLTVAWTSLAPAQVVQGRQNATMLSLRLSVDFGTAYVTGIRVDKRGTSALDSDVARAKLWLDANKDGIFDSGDVLEGQGSFVAGTTTISGFNVSVSVNSPATLFVTFDISPTATTGVTVAARLANPTYLAVDAPTTVSGQNFPAVSAASLIVVPGSGAHLTIQSVDLAIWTPTAYLGQAGIAMEKLYLTVDQNTGVVTGIHIDRTGTSTNDASVAAARLYLDSVGSGNFSAGDTLLGSSAFVAGVALFGNLNLQVPFNKPVTLFLVFNIGTAATEIGKMVGLELATSSYMVGNATTTVDPNAFPIASSEVTIAAGSLSGTVKEANGNPIANATVRLPQLNRTATTDANGRYSFANLPLGSFYVVASDAGYVSVNKTANVTASSPNAVLNLVLASAPSTAAFNAGLWAGLIGVLVVVALGAVLFLVIRRRSTCPVCGRTKAKDKDVCPECEAKGLRPGATPPPPPPPPAP